ncbi:haloacid dehalogenase-like hydrolase [Gramella lutea]|uniref:Haloacid dehalogenase-like hydrolase n=1 Tax=Christiangramia lutea TaxID=1607951 RepID=A0A9X1UZZ6_9FLAO|nr:HAD family hydrolase [Christiangramia lutea]MCH4821747.1 haloacid dehalogenase-like hydrolase [Christiangramia lutea]
MKSINPTFYILIFVLAVFGCKDNKSNDSIQEDEVITSNSNKVNDLAAWADAPKERIMNWVEKVTDSTNSDFIPETDRIAVFDNDGTLWPEQPAPTQLLYVLDFLKKEYQNQPEWKNDPVISAAVNGDYGPLKEKGAAGILDMVNKSYDSMSEEDYKESVREWMDTTKIEKFDMTYKEAVYLPMLQLLEYLRAHDFKTFIVSGGGADFMRVWTEEVYGIPPNQVIGSYGEVAFDNTDGKATVYKKEGDFFFDDKSAKPEAIHRFIGKKPVLVGGNSDGDQAMMEYASNAEYPTLCIILHHTDAEREYAYDTKTLSGHLETALEMAKEKNWLVVDMKEDFKQIFPD